MIRRPCLSPVQAFRSPLRVTAVHLDAANKIAAILAIANG
jgi:hypothetical protein